MRVRPGPSNLITDVDGIKVGNAEDTVAISGTTVVLPDVATLAAVDVRGGGPGTRETETMDPINLVDRVDAIVLSGGSAFGLDAASGAVEWLVKQRRGIEVKGHLVPIVPTAILFDLDNGGNKDWGTQPPYRDLARRAIAAAGTEFALGNAGAGLGATTGGLRGVMQGGLGSVSAVTDDGIQVGALIAVNPFGSPLIGDTGTFWAWALEQGNEFGACSPPTAGLKDGLEISFDGEPAGNTTIGVIAVNAALDKAQAKRIAIMAHDGLARAIRPLHTPMDGDTIFVLATGARPLGDPVPARLARLGSLAADCAARAVARGVYAAAGIGDIPGYKDLFAGD